MNNNINKEQNKEEYLRYRYVSRKLYSGEKNYRNFILIIGIIIYLVGLVPSIKDIKLISFMPILWLIASEIFKRQKLNTHLRAVQYHEYCDRRMFELTGLESLIDNKDILFQEAISITGNEKEKKSFEDMIKKEHKISIKDWYNNFSRLPLDIARIMAQDENVTWERKQRQAYQVLLIIVIVVLVSISVSMVYYTKNGTTNIIFAVPVIWEFILLVLDNCDNIKRCKSIQAKIGKSYNEIRTNGKNYIVETMNNSGNEIQFNIYENRKDSIPVPDIIYKLFRNKLQKESDSYMKNIKKEILNALK